MDGMAFEFFGGFRKDNQEKSPEENDRAHEKNIRKLTGAFADRYAEDHIAETYEQTKKMFPEFTHEELHARAAKTLEEKLRKTVE